MYKRVFIVDDDEVSVFLTETILAAEDLAQEFHTFLSPADALDKLLPLLQQADRLQLPDLLFLDLNMPIMSGWDFLDALQPYACLLQEHCSIYILSSSVDAYEIKRAKEYSLLAGFLQKPICEEAIRKLALA